MRIHLLSEVNIFLFRSFKKLRMDMPALTNMQKKKIISFYLFEVHFTDTKVDLVSYFVEQKNKKGKEGSWNVGRRIGEEKKDIRSIVMFLRGMNGNHRPAGL